MYFESKRKSECFGCTACEQVCPCRCIEMQYDEDGFLFPVMVSPDDCSHCKRCQKVCPFCPEKTEDGNVPRCYYGWHTDSETRKGSTSGGAFIAISQVCEQLGYSHFYGAVYTEHHRVCHVGSGSARRLGKMQSSKYVQSDLGECYSTIEKLLRKGDKVVFSGTPCQAVGLQNYVGEMRENLFTLSLVCHGVASPGAFGKYLMETEKKYKGKIDSVRFRDKRKKDGELSHRFTTITMKDGTIFADTDNPYITAFGMGLMQRKICFSCPYTTPYRNTDITIGDFWGIEENKPELKCEVSKGISMILAHTKKGKELAGRLWQRMNIEEVPMEWALHERQPNLKLPMGYNPRRDQFLRKILRGNQSFAKVARYEILRWRVRKYCYRLKRKKNIQTDERVA